jgi:hypothetical protein
MRSDLHLRGDRSGRSPFRPRWPSRSPLNPPRARRRAARVAARVLAALLCVLCVEKPLRAEPVLVDRIVAVVEGRPVLLSEVRVLEQVAQLDAERALEALIDERLMYREAARLPQAAVSAAEEDRALQSLRARAPAAAALPERGLRLLARRQATIVKYVEFRFRPQVRVDEDAVRRAYEDAWRARDDRPEFDAVAPDLRTRLAEEDLKQRIEAWVKELRAGAEVRYNVGSPPAAAEADGS